MLQMPLRYVCFMSSKSICSSKIHDLYSAEGNLEMIHQPLAGGHFVTSSQKQDRFVISHICGRSCCYVKASDR